MKNPLGSDFVPFLGGAIVFALVGLVLALAGGFKIAEVALIIVTCASFASLMITMVIQEIRYRKRLRPPRGEGDTTNP